MDQAELNVEPVDFLGIDLGIVNIATKRRREEERRARDINHKIAMWWPRLGYLPRP
ncbi:hypothetical protein [Streptomyces sp. NBC_00365]|uniref:hypothetical protein n=1 Tax=Streptomyces sp. NBC_00365 TaxID=2975726 RepID=UPI002B1D70EA|nr:hypothetical protein [Streptomyces sp. NBC_00365]